MKPELEIDVLKVKLFTRHLAGQELLKALERIHKLSLKGTNDISIEVSRICSQAISQSGEIFKE